MSEMAEWIKNIYDLTICCLEETHICVNENKNLIYRNMKTVT